MAEVIEMPKLSDTMSVGTLVKWLVKEGDTVSSGDMLCEVETDKATMEVENFEEGIVLKHYVPEGGQIPVGAPMCAIGQKGEEAPQVEVPEAPRETEESDGDTGGETEAREAPAEDSGNKASEETKRPTPIKPKADAAEEIPASEPSKTSEPADLPAPRKEGERIRISPLARKLAEQKGVDVTTLKGSGPAGRIIRADVEAAAAAGPAAKSPPAQEEGEPAAATTRFTAQPGLEVQSDEAVKVSNMRATIARRLVESKTQIPHFYLETEIDAAPLLEARQAINASLAELPPEQGGLKVSVNDIILKAVVDALRRVPAVNASWMGESVQKHGAVHLAFGVAIDEGLITPVIKDAHAKGLRQIALEARELIGKARNRKLKPDEMTGSTFTVTNLGMFDTVRFYGIINPPNAGILSVGATVKKPVVDKNDAIVVGQRMSIGFSGDHRVVDGATGAQFLNALRQVLENPALMLV